MLKNDHLPFDQLPKVADLPFENFPRASIICSAFSMLIMWAVVIAGSIVLALVWEDARPQIEMIWIWGWPLLLVQVAWPVVAWKYHRVALREHDVVLTEGVLIRTLRAQALARIQHITLHQNLLQRQFGLATLVLYSAGKDAHEFKLRHLSMARAEQLRDFVLHGARLA